MYEHFTLKKKNYYFKGTSQIRKLVKKERKESDKNKRKKWDEKKKKTQNNVNVHVSNREKKK